MIKYKKSLKLHQEFAKFFFWRGDRSHHFQYFSELASNLQLISIIGSMQSHFQGSTKNNPLNTFIQKVFDMVSSFKISSTNSTNVASNLITCIIWSYLVFVVLFGIFIFWKCYKKLKVHDIIHSVYGYWVQLHHSFIFWIIHSILLSRLKKVIFDNMDPFGNESGHIEVILDGIFVLVNLLFGILASVFCYDPFMTRNPFSMRSSTYQTMTLFFKIILGFVTNLISDKDTLKWAFLIICALITGIRYEFIFRTVPYYKRSVLSLMSGFSGCAFFLSLVGLIMSILTELNLSGWSSFDFIQILLIPLALKLTQLRIQSLTSQYDSLSINSLKKSSDIFKKLLALEYNTENFSNDSYKLSQIFFHANVTEHQQQCIDKECFCNSLIPDDFKTKNIVKKENILDIKISLLDLAVEWFRKDNELRIHYIFFLLQKQNKFSKSLFTIFDIDNSRITLKQKIVLSFISELFEKKSSTAVKPINSREKFNINRVLDCHEMSNELIILLGKYTFEYIQLWYYYQQPDMLLKEFFRKTIQLELKAQQIETLWTGISKTYENIPNDMLLIYQSYFTLLRNAPYTASKSCNSITSYGTLANLDSPIFRTQSDKKISVIIYVSMTKEKLGNIIQASHNVEHEYGWSQANLTGQNIHNIMPLYLRERHQQLMQSYLEDDKKPPSFHNQSFIQVQKGHIIPVDVSITIYPHINTEPIYVAIIQKRAMHGEVLVIGSDGIISSFSKVIASKLGLDIKKKVHISEVCIDYQKIGLNMLKRRRTDFININDNNSLNKMSEDLKNSSEKGESFTIPPKKEIILRFRSTLQQKELSILAQSEKIANSSGMKAIKTNLKEGCFSDTKEILYLVNVQNIELSGDNFIFLSITEQKTSAKGIITEEKLFSNDLVAKNQDLNIPRLNDDTRLKTDIISSKSKSDKKMNNNLLENSHYSNENQRLDSYKERIFSKIIKRDLSREDYSKEENEEIQRPEMIQTISFNSTDRREKVDLRKLEEAIYLIPQDKHTKILNWLIIAFSSLCLCFMVLHLVNSNQRLNEAANQIDYIAAVARRSVQLIDLYRNVKFITLVNSGLMSELRHLTLGTKSFRTLRRQALKDNREQLISLDNFIINNVNEKINSEISYQLIRVNDNNTTLAKRQVNSFELMTEICNTAGLLFKTNIEAITVQNTNVQFIFQNSLNDLFIVDQKLIQKINASSEDYLQLTKRDIWIFLFVVCFTGVFLLVVLGFDIYDFFKKRDKIINLLSKVSVKQLSNHMKNILTFYERFWGDKSNEYKNFKTEVASTISGNAKGQNKKFGKIKSNFNCKGLNTQITKGIIFTILCILIFSSVFPLLKVAYGLREDTFLDQFNKMVKTNLYFLNVNLAITISLSYMSGDNATVVKGMVLEEAIYKILDQARELPGILSSLVLNEAPDIYTLSLTNLLFGDLCQLTPGPVIPFALCQKLGGGSATNGLIRLENYMIKGNEDSLFSYAFSNRTYEASKQALNLEALIGVEQVGSYSLRASEAVRNILKIKNRDSIINYRDETTWVIIVYLLIYIILGLLLSTIIWKRIKEERTSWKKLIRHVPFSVILENKEFENFLLKNYDNYSLTSIKTTF